MGCAQRDQSDNKTYEYAKGQRSRPSARAPLATVLGRMTSHPVMLRYTAARLPISAAAGKRALTCDGGCLITSGARAVCRATTLPRRGPTIDLDGRPPQVRACETCKRGVRAWAWCDVNVCVIKPLRVRGAGGGRVWRLPSMALALCGAMPHFSRRLPCASALVWLLPPAAHVSVARVGHWRRRLLHAPATCICMHRVHASACVEQQACLKVSANDATKSNADCSVKNTTIRAF